MAGIEERCAEQRSRRRVDAERNLQALLESAKVVFATTGVDAPAKEITDGAGLGVGTLYRHFPRRSDLIVAVLEHEIDACAEAACGVRGDPGAHEALRHWVGRYVDLVATKCGLAGALQSGDAAFVGLQDYFAEKLEPAVADLLADAREAGELRCDIDARELLYAVALLCHEVPVEGFDIDYNRRMAMVFVDGLRQPTA